MGNTNLIKKSEKELKQLGWPDWTLNKLKNDCMQGCKYWKEGNCQNTAMLCCTEYRKDQKQPLKGEYVFHYTLRFIFGIYKIMDYKIEKNSKREIKT